MKSIKMFFMLSMVVVLFSCKNNDEPKINTTFGFDYNGKFYATPFIFIESTNQNKDGLFEHRLLFLSEGLEDYPISGTSGYFVSITLFSENTNSIDPGEYIYSEESFLSTFSKSMVVLDFEYPSSFGQTIIIKGGTVLIQESNGQLSVTYSLTRSDGSFIEGQYGPDN